MHSRFELVEASFVVPLQGTPTKSATSSSSSSSSSSWIQRWSHSRTNLLHPQRQEQQAVIFNLMAEPPSSTSTSISKAASSKAPYPKVGDVVRYQELDGGKANGQVLTGRISLIQKVLLPSTKSSSSLHTSEEDDSNEEEAHQWLAEVTQLDELGDGYYTDFSSRKRASKRVLRPIGSLTPLPASFVRSEMAWKVPNIPLYTNYNLVGYKGPQAELHKKNSFSSTDNNMILEQDKKAYNALKLQLLRDATFFGLGGTLLVQFLKGLDDALIYLAGALAGVGYLFFLSVKTDTIGLTTTTLPSSMSNTTPQPQTLQVLQQGNKIANIRFLLPFFVLIGVAIRNASLVQSSSSSSSMETVGGGFENIDFTNSVAAMNLLHTVTPEQFGAAMLGFLTYRIPLILYQLGPAIADAVGINKKDINLTGGSLGVALQLAQGASSSRASSTSTASSTSRNTNVQTILLVSGPSGTGKTTLVQRFIQQDNGNHFAMPKYVDRYAEPVTFERLNSRGEFLYIDPTGRYGLTMDGIRKPVKKENRSNDSLVNVDEDIPPKVVVVVDASVDLAKKLTQVPGIRIVGVWIGLDSLEKFEQRIKAQIESGKIYVGSDETAEDVLRGKIRQIVKDIEYGIVSGIFEFTILNEDMEQSLDQLKKAAAYCLVD